MAEILVLNGDSPQEAYEELFQQEEGTYFKVESDYETVMMRIEDYKPSEGDFEVFPVNPGTAPYSLLGPDHCVITKNTLNAE